MGRQKARAMPPSSRPRSAGPRPAPAPPAGKPRAGRFPRPGARRAISPSICGARLETSTGDIAREGSQCVEGLDQGRACRHVLLAQPGGFGKRPVGDVDQRHLPLQSVVCRPFRRPPVCGNAPGLADCCAQTCFGRDDGIVLLAQRFEIVGKRPVAVRASMAERRIRVTGPHPKREEHGQAAAGHPRPPTARRTGCRGGPPADPPRHRPRRSAGPWWRRRCRRSRASRERGPEQRSDQGETESAAGHHATGHRRPASQDAKGDAQELRAVAVVDAVADGDQEAAERHVDEDRQAEELGSQQGLQESEQGARRKAPAQAMPVEHDQVRHQQPQSLHAFRLRPVAQESPLA